MMMAMKLNVRVLISIVISAVLLGLAVSYCVSMWMPVGFSSWVLWIVSAMLALVAIYRISLLGRSLRSDE